MTALTALNDYSNSTIDLSIEDQNIRQSADNPVRLPCLTWNPIHDIGNTLNEIRIRYNFPYDTYTMSDGSILNEDEYLAYIETHPRFKYTASNLSIIEDDTFNYLQAWSFTEDTIYADWIDLDLSDVNINFTNNNWCIDGWFRLSGETRFNTQPGYDTPIAGYLWRHQDTGFYINEQSKTITYWVTGIGNYQIDISSQWNEIANQKWFYVALTYDGSYVRLYLNYKRIDFEYAPSVTIDKSQVFTLFGRYNKDAAQSDKHEGVIPGTVRQFRIADIARHTSSGVSLSTVRDRWNYTDANTKFLLQVGSNGNITTAEDIEILIEYWEAPVFPLPPTLDDLGSNASVNITKTDYSEWTVSGIYTIEDYFAATAYLHFETGSTGSDWFWDTRIWNVALPDLDFNFKTNLLLE